MAREHARVKLSIWEDDDFRGLSGNAQRLYFLLMTSLKLDYCGVTDWRPVRLAPLCSDWTVADVEQAGEELSAARYIVVDVETEEVLLRSFIRHDELLESPNMAIAMRKAHGAVASTALRQIVVFELRRLHADQPSLKGWSKVSDMLDRTPLDPAGYPSFTASGNLSPNPSEKGSGNLSANGDPTPSPDPSVSTSPTTAPTPAPNSKGQERPAQKRGTRLPENWKPSSAVIDWQRETGISDLIARRELPKFVDYWTAKAGRDATKIDWDATWRVWLRNTIEREPSPLGERPVSSHANAMTLLSRGPRP